MGQACNRRRGERRGSWNLLCQGAGNTTDHGGAEQHEYQTEGTAHSGSP